MYVFQQFIRLPVALFVSQHQGPSHDQNLFHMIGVAFMKNSPLAQQTLQRDASRTMRQTPATKRSYNARNPIQHKWHDPKCRKTEPPTPSRKTPQPGEDQANRRYVELWKDIQDFLHVCNNVWGTSWKFPNHPEDGFRKSWRAAMENFELVVRIVSNDTITSHDPKRLCPLMRYRLGDAAAMLWANNRNSTGTVWLDHMSHLQEVTQAISEQVCWKTILIELLTNETLTENARRQQTTYLNTKIYDLQLKIQEAIEEANAHALPQDQQKRTERQKRSESTWWQQQRCA